MKYLFLILSVIFLFSGTSYAVNCVPKWDPVSNTIDLCNARVINIQDPIDDSDAATRLFASQQGGGAQVILDFNDDGSNEGTNLNEIATINDSNSIFTSPALNKLLIDISKPWPLADGLVPGGLDDMSMISNTILTGNGTQLATFSGSFTGGNCIEIDTNGNLVDAGAPCGTGSGGGSGDITAVGSCTSGSCFTDDVVQTNPIWTMEGSTSDVFETIWNITDPTADRTITIPDASGEISLLGQSISGSEIEDNSVSIVDLDFDPATQNELDNKSAATSTSNALAVFSNTTGDLKDSKCIYSESGTTTIGGGIDCGPNDAGPSEMVFYEDSDNGTNTLTLKPTASIAADRTVTFPDASGEISLLGQTIEGSEIADGTVAAADIATDAVGTSELNDGTDTPTAGQVVVVATTTSQIEYIDQSTLSVGSATQLAANGSNCSAGNFPLGVDAFGNVEGCTDVATEDEFSAHKSDTSNPHSVTGAQVSFSDPDNKFAATNVEAAIAELDDNNVLGPNTADGKVSWTQLVDVPAGFADGTDDTSAGGGGMTSFDVQDDASVNLTISDAETLKIQGGSGVDTAATAGNPELLDISLDLTEISSPTISDGTSASLVWTYNISGTVDPVVTYSDGNVDFNTDVTASSFTADPTATPFLVYDDSDTTTTEDVKIDVNCPGTTSGSEYCDYSLKVMNKEGSNTSALSEVFYAIGDSGSGNGQVKFSSDSYVFNGLDCSGTGQWLDVDSSGTLLCNTINYVDSGSTFPSSPFTGQLFIFTADPNVGDCNTAGGGSAVTFCRYNGTSWVKVGDGTGAGGTMTSFTVSADSGTDQVINDGNVLTIQGGTNGIDTVVGATDLVTLNLDTTEIESTTYGGGTNASIAWTFDVTGTVDPVLTFQDNSVSFNTDISAKSVSIDPSSTPKMDFVDADTTDQDISATILVDCTSTASAAEDCDLSIGAQQNGSVASSNYFFIYDSDTGSGTDELILDASSYKFSSLTAPATEFRCLHIDENGVMSMASADCGTGTGSSLWQDTSGVVNLITSTNSVTVGSSSSLAKLAVDSDTTTEVSFLIQAVASQTADLLVIEDSTGSDLLTVDSSGVLSFTGSNAGLKLNVSAVLTHNMFVVPSTNAPVESTIHTNFPKNVWQFSSGSATDTLYFEVPLDSAFDTNSAVSVDITWSSSYTTDTDAPCFCVELQGVASGESLDPTQGTATCADGSSFSTVADSPVTTTITLSSPGLAAGDIIVGRFYRDGDSSETSCTGTDSSTVPVDVHHVSLNYGIIEK